jgi:ABC-2 type transport system ATP-binding protein
MAPLIEVESLVVERGGFRLEVPRWEVEPGHIVGLVGPNGAGKTTLLETVAGLRPSQSGRMRVFGHDPWDEPSIVRSSLGYMSDDVPVFVMRVAALLKLVSGYYPRWDAALAQALVDRFGLDLSQRTDKLSKGQGARLRLVLALSFRPRVLLLDEPATGMDLAGRRALVQSVLEVCREAEGSVVLSSHQLSDVERLCDRLLVLQDGRPVCEGRADALVGEGQTLADALVQRGVL